MASKIKVDELETVSGSGVITVNQPLSGSGASLTALNGSNISSGTVADARLPATITATTFKGEGAINGWIVMNGVGTVSIFDSYNVSSLTDSGVGLYGINWDTDFNSAYYANTALVKAYSGGTEYIVIANINSATTNIKAYAGSSLSDKSEIYVTAIGDSA